MEINWFTFIAQIVNFGIVLFLLRRFLYGPVLQVMADREAQITARFEEAEEMAREAKSEGEAYRSERDKLAAQRDELLQEARERAESRRVEMLDEARAEVDAMQQSWYDAVEQEKERFLQELRVRMGETVYHVARDALSDLAGKELEEAIASEFLGKLNARRSGDGDAHWTAEQDDVIVVRSAFELAPDMQEEIHVALTGSSPAEHNDSSGNEDSRSNDGYERTSVAFMVSPDLICGIEAQFGSRRVAWSIRDYLDSYAEQLDETLVAAMGNRPMPHVTGLDEAAAGGILPG